MRKAVQQKMEFKSSYEQLSCLDWKFLPNWDFSNTYIPNRNRSQKGRINEQNIQPDMLNDLSANKSDDRKPDYLRMFMEAFFEGDCKKVFSSIQPTQPIISSLYPFSSYRTYSR